MNRDQYELSFFKGKDDATKPSSTTSALTQATTVYDYKISSRKQVPAAQKKRE